MVPHWLIERKRDGGALSEEEIRFFINGFTEGSIPDYQMSALTMAIYFQGMTPEETAVLTDVMMHSGAVVDTSSIDAPKADKHSTGGIGDKVSLVLAPLVACCGIAVPMISGRGLGITGGTLDKLESIPGYRTDLDEMEFLRTIQRCGCSIIGQTNELAPADKKLYALRDVTATVPSIPLIVASIMSKKLAEGIDALVLDVKCGKGAFMKSPARAGDLARALVGVGRRMGKKTAAIITHMDQPLGRTAGNALEVVEAVEALQGRGPADLMEVTMALSACLLMLTGIEEDPAQARALLQRKVANGEAMQRFREMVAAQGGAVSVLDDLSGLPAASIRNPFPAGADGYVAEVDAERIGRACIVLGAGRQKTTDDIDPGVGIADLVSVGDRVVAGEPLLTIHANDPRRADAAKPYLDGAFRITPEAVDPPPLIIDTLLPSAAPA